jgi:hypothetical protein
MKLYPVGWQEGDQMGPNGGVLSVAGTHSQVDDLGTTASAPGYVELRHP